MLHHHHHHLITIVCTLLIDYTRAGLDYDDVLDQIGAVDGAGVKMRLSTTGLAYVREIGMRIINRELPKLQFPIVTANVQPEGTVTISDMKVIDYWAPTEYQLDMIPPDKFSWTTINMGIRTAGNFKGDVKMPIVGIPVKAEGQFDALIPHIANSVTIQLGVSPDFYPTVNVTRCTFVVDNVDLMLKGADFIANTLNLFKDIVSGQVKPNLERQVCARLTQMINGDLNRMLATLPLKIPLSATRINPPETALRLKRAATSAHFDYYDYTNGVDAKTVKERPITVQINANEYKDVHIESMDFNKFVYRIRSKDLIVDLRLKKSPEIAFGHAVSTQFGEISWQGLGGTPFRPALMAEQPTPGSQMLQLYVGDYVANSLLYHAYKHNLLKIGVTGRDSVNLDHLLRTTCIDTIGVCIGDLLTDVRQTFPQHAVDVDLTSTTAPTALVDEGGIRVNSSSVVNMYVRRLSDTTDQRLLIVTATMALHATLQLQFADNAQRMTGTLKIDQLKLVKTYARLATTDQFTINELADLSRGMMEKMAQGVLDRGIPLPKIKGFSFKNPTLSLHRHSVLVNTYFVIDEDYIGQLISNAVSNAVG